MGKKRSDAMKGFDPDADYEPSAALGLVKKMATASFDESVEAAFNLNIDARQADQAVRGTVSLPHGTGKTIKVAVFADGDKAKEAEEAGADMVGGSELAEAVTSGTQSIDWDLTIAHPSLMAEVGKLGKVLGPRGLMPNPKAGTVTDDIGKTVSEFKAGKVEYRNDRYGNVHVVIGKASFSEDQLTENLGTLIAELQRVRPAAVKGRFMKRVTVSSTMGPGVELEAGGIEALWIRSQ